MYIFKEIQPDFSNYFDGDCYSGYHDFTKEEYIYNLFIISDGYGFNTEEYNRMKEKLEGIFNDFLSKEEGSKETYKSIMEYWGIPYNSTACNKLKKLYGSVNCTWDINTETIAKFLSIITKKTWSTISCYGYCQGDYCTVVYCEEGNSEPENEGDIFLGCAKEFSLTEIDSNGKEIDTVYGYYVSDYAYDKYGRDYKKILCDYEGIKPEETKLYLITGTRTELVYSEY